jgi:hypothetical protein
MAKLRDLGIPGWRGMPRSLKQRQKERRQNKEMPKELPPVLSKKEDQDQRPAVVNPSSDAGPDDGPWGVNSRLPDEPPLGVDINHVCDMTTVSGKPRVNQ